MRLITIGQVIIGLAAITLLLPVCASAQTMVTVTKGRLPIRVQSEESIRKTPGGVSLVDKTAWQDQRASTVKDMVDYTPGVFVQPRNGAESMRLSIRGSGLTRMFQGRGLLVMQDGIPINMADGGFEFPVIDPWLIDYAEIYRGANATEFGTSTFGGGVNFVTPTGFSQKGGMLRTELGGYGDARGMVSYGMRSGNMDGYAAISGFYQDGFRDNNQQGTGRFNSNIGWMDGEITHRFYLSHTDTDARIPGAISKAEIRRDPKRANPNNVNGRYQRNIDITRMAYKTNWDLGNEQVETTVFHTYRYLDNPVTTYLKEHNNDSGFRGKYTRQSGMDRMIGGVNISYGTGDESRFGNSAGRPAARILNRQLSALTSELYGQYEKHMIAQLYGIAALQGTYAKRDISQSLPLSVKQEKDYAGLNPRVGLRYDMAYDTQVFTNLSRSFEPPTLDELSGGNAPGFEKLKAQKATTAEIGARGKWQKMQWEAAYYHGWFKNEFINYRFADGTTNTINADRTKRDGIELGLGGHVIDSWLREADFVTMRTAYSWNHFTLDNDPLYGSRDLPGVPKHYLRSDMVYHHPSGFSFGPNIEFVPTGSYVDLTNSIRSDRYITYGISAAWQVPKRDLSFYVDMRNIADRRYVATTNVIPDAAGNDGRFFYPGEGRAVFAGLRAGF